MIWTDCYSRRSDYFFTTSQSCKTVIWQRSHQHRLGLVVSWNQPNLETMSSTMFIWGHMLSASVHTAPLGCRALYMFTGSKMVSQIALLWFVFNSTREEKHQHSILYKFEEKHHFPLMQYWRLYLSKLLETLFGILCEGLYICFNRLWS